MNGVTNNLLSTIQVGQKVLYWNLMCEDRVIADATVISEPVYPLYGDKYTIKVRIEEINYMCPGTEISIGDEIEIDLSYVLLIK